MLGSFYKTYYGEDDKGLTCADIVEVRVIDQEEPFITVVGSCDPNHALCNGIDHCCVEKKVATHDVNYQDPGANCTDFVDGQINGAIETNSFNVDLTTPGSYNITYDCEDISGHTAQQELRIVQVTDDCTHTDMNFTGPTGQKTCCPRVTVTGGTDVLWREAGIPYVDAGATATDDLDGSLTASIVYGGLTTGNMQLINQHAFYSRADCLDMMNSVDYHLDNGVYFLTQHGTTDRYKAYCYFESNAADTFRHITIDTAINPLNYTASTTECNAKGMAAIDWNMTTNTNAIIPRQAAGFLGVENAVFGNTGTDAKPMNSDTVDLLCVPKTDIDGVYFNANDGDAYAYRETGDSTHPATVTTPHPNPNATYYADIHHQAAGSMVNGISGTQDATAPHTHFYQYPSTYNNNPGSDHNISEDKIRVSMDLTNHTQPQFYSSSEPGKYIITYRVTDSVGNTECLTGRRTVIIRDTMPPIIALRVKTINGAIKKQYSIEDPSTGDALKGLPSGSSATATQNTDAWNKVQGWANGAFPYNDPSAHAHRDNLFDATFMATRVSPANAWVVGAVVAVSAVVFGVYSKRRLTQQTIDV